MGRWGRAPGCSCRPGGREWGGPEHHGTPAEPERAADGDVRGRGDSRPLRKHKDGGLILSSWPEARLTRSHRQGNNTGRAASGVSGPRPPLRKSWPTSAAAPGVGSPTRRDKEAVAAAAPPAPARCTPPSFLQPLWGAIQGRGSARGRQGEGPACPVELLFCMTQWFLEKALLGFLSEACAWRGMRVGLGDQWDPNLI